MSIIEGETPNAATPQVELRRVALTPMSAVWIALGIFGAFFTVAFVQNVPDTITRVALGIVFAFALDPVVVRLRRSLHCSRGVAVAVVGSLALLIFAVLMIVIGPRAVDQARQFSRELPATVDQLSSLPLVGGVLDRFDASENIRKWSADLPSRIDDQAITQYVSVLVDGLLAGLTVLVVGVAVLSDGERLLDRVRNLVPHRHRPRAGQIGRIFYRTIGAYFAGSLLVASLAATFVLAVGLALGVPLAPAAALWVLMVNFIPQIGGALGGSVFTVLGLARSPGTALLCLVIYVIYMNIENHIIQPIVIGNAVDLSAAATMIAALMGAAAAGVPGAILAAPLAGTVKALYLELHPDASRRERPRRKGPRERLRELVRRR